MYTLYTLVYMPPCTSWSIRHPVHPWVYLPVSLLGILASLGVYTGILASLVYNGEYSLPGCITVYIASLVCIAG